MAGDIRAKVAAVAALVTVALLSFLSAIGFVTMVNVMRNSQIDLLNERLNQVETRLFDQDAQLTSRSELGLDIRVVRRGEVMPPRRSGTIRIIREVQLPEVDALVATAPTRQIDETLQAIRTGLWVSVLVVGLLVGIAAWFAVDRALAPVRHLTRQARTIEADQSLQLLPVTASGNEISELAATFNSMLTKLRSADTERRRFVSDASHELRTPLMVLSADAEYAAEHGGATTDLAESVLSQSERLTTLVDDLLTLASLDETQSQTYEMVPVAEVLASAAASRFLSGADDDILSVEIPNVSRALANVVANARRHMAETMVVSIERNEQTLTFVIDDDGDGVPPDQRDHIFKRFYRPDGGRSRTDGGAGLGLAIARVELNMAAGSIEVGESPLGGAQFSLSVPWA